MIKAISLIVLLSFSTATCSFTDYFIEVSSGAVLFQDDFSDPNSGWQNVSQPNSGIMEYFDGYYRIEVNGEYQLLSTGPGLNFSDVRIEADTIKVIGDRDDMYGLVCRAVDRNNFYFFVISSDGYYGVGKMINGIQQLIEMPGMMPSEEIFQDKAINHLRADCLAEQLSFFVNGKKLVSVSDSDLTNGDVGFINGTLQSFQNVVLFDNFSVQQP